VSRCGAQGAVQSLVRWKNQRWIGANVVADFASNLAARRALAAPTAFSATSTATPASAKVAGSAGAVARRCRRRGFQFFTGCGAKFTRLRFIIIYCEPPPPRRCATRLGHRTIGRDRFIQVFILLFQIHEIGDVQKGVAFQSNVHKGRLHAWQHARDPAFINRAAKVYSFSRSR